MRKTIISLFLLLPAVAMAGKTDVAPKLRQLRPVHVFAERPPPSYLAREQIAQTVSNFPLAATEECVKGSAWVEFALTDDGKAQNPAVTKSYPPGVYDAAVLEALAIWVFPADDAEGAALNRNALLPFVFHPPCIVRDASPTQGSAVHVYPLHEKVHPEVSHDDMPLMLELLATRAVSPQYPAAAFRACKGGVVYAEFVVDRDGKPRDIEIVAAEGHRSFKKAVTRAVASSRFRPYDIAGRAEPARGVLSFEFPASEHCKT